MGKKIRVSLVYEYEPDPSRYPECDFLEDMMDVDKQNADDDPFGFANMLQENGEFKFEIIEAKTTDEQSGE